MSMHRLYSLYNNTNSYLRALPRILHARFVAAIVIALQEHTERVLEKCTCVKLRLDALGIRLKSQCTWY
jgi:hypothetical protein